MPRDLPLSNRSLLVAFDLEHRIRDVYFPACPTCGHVPEEAPATQNTR